VCVSGVVEADDVTLARRVSLSDPSPGARGLDDCATARPLTSAKLLCVDAELT